MLVALDTNILVYLAGLDGAERKDRCVAVVGVLPSRSIVVPVQVLAEMRRVLLKKGAGRVAAYEEIRKWAELYRTVDTTYSVFEQSLELVHRHGMQVFDVIILSASAGAGCSILLTEDGHHGFSWRDCTIVSPFHDPMHPLLIEALNKQ